MISVAVQKGASITIYNEHGRCQACCSAYQGLMGYTATTVTVKNGTAATLFDEFGNCKGSVSLF